jgi:hypothetical protein
MTERNMIIITMVSGYNHKLLNTQSDINIILMPGPNHKVHKCNESKAFCFATKTNKTKKFFSFTVQSQILLAYTIVILIKSHPSLYDDVLQ